LGDRAEEISVLVQETLTPDLEINLHLDAFAPRLARHCLEEVGHLAPDLRDAVSLLTSDLVTRAVRGCPADVEPEVRLSAWVPKDLVRVELRAPDALLLDVDCSPYERALLDQVADRWSIEDTGSTAWFEIDRA
jgi:hypothetical protein